MAVAGPDYECIYADVGTNGRVSDGVVWNKCTLSQGTEDGSVYLPPAKCLPYGVTKLPTVLELPSRTTESLVMTALVIHNYLRKSSSRNVYCPAGLLETESRSGKLPRGLWGREVTSEAFVPLSVQSLDTNQQVIQN